MRAHFLLVAVEAHHRFQKCFLANILRHSHELLLLPLAKQRVFVKSFETQRLSVSLEVPARALLEPLSVETATQLQN